MLKGTFKAPYHQLFVERRNSFCLAIAASPGVWTPTFNLTRSLCYSLHRTNANSSVCAAILTTGTILTSRNRRTENSI